MSLPLKASLLGHGGFDCGGPLRFPYAKAQALLVLLMLEPSAWPRDRLTGLLWPRQDTTQARTNLRNAVHLLRRLVGSERVVNRPEGIGWCAQPGDEVDVHRLQASAPQGLLAVLDAYQGELLAGFLVPDAPGFMEWLDLQRLSCQAQVMTRLDGLFVSANACGDHELALAVARVQGRIDPWSEPSQHRLIQCLADAGQYQAALAQWDVACEQFQRQLDAPPGSALQDLVQRLQASLRGTTAPTLTAPATAPPASSPSGLVAAALLHAELRVVEPGDVSAWPHLQAIERGLAAAAQASGGQMQLASGGGALMRFDVREGRASPCERALAAALEVLGAWRAHADADRLFFSIGLHRGDLMPAQGARLDPLGQHSSVAAGLAGMAQLGELLASPAFVQRLGPQPWVPWRGPAAPAQSPAQGQGALAALRWAGPLHGAAREPSPLLGRSRQQSALRQLWRKATEGGGGLRATLLHGEAGSGKSRLSRWALAQLAPQGRGWWIACQPARSEAPAAPLAAWLASVGGLADAVALGGDAGDAWAVLRAWLGTHAPGLPDEHVLTLARLLGLSRDDSAFTPTRRRLALIAAFVALFRRVLQAGPLLLVIDDLHWADATTVSVLDALAQELGPQPLMLLGTSRPQDGGGMNWPRIDVPALSPVQSLRLARHVLSAQAHAHAHGLAPADAERQEDARLQQVVARSHGNPLFIESLAHVAHLAPAATGGVPESLEEGLLLCLAADPVAQTVAQAASVLGEVFDVADLRALCPAMSEEAFQAALRRLLRHGLVAREGERARFRHALICDAVHASLPLARCRQLHEEVLRQALAADASLAERQPLWLARHADIAGQLDQSSCWFEQAAWQSLSVAAFTEAQQHFARALEVLERMPVSAIDPHRAMRLALGRAQSTVPVCGYGADETRHAYTAVLKLGARQAGSEGVFQAHYGLWLGASSHGGYRQALLDVQRVQAQADLSGHPVHQLQSAYAWGNTHLWLGELADARTHLGRALARAEALPLATPLQHHSEDSGVTAAALLAWACWLQGDEAQALQHQATSLARAQALQHPYSIAFALACAGRLAILRGDANGVAAHVDELDALAERHELGLWRALVLAERGWMLCAQGRAEGVWQTAQGVALGAPALPALEVTLLSMQADGLHRLGDRLACARVVAQALRRCKHWDDRYMQPELLRLAAWCEPDERLAAQHRAQARAQAQAQGALAWLAKLDSPPSRG